MHNSQPSTKSVRSPYLEQQPMEPFDFGQLGAIERKPDPRDYPLGAVQAPVSRPATYLPDNSWLVRNFQGKTPTCGAHASSHFKAILDHILVPTSTPHYTPRFAWIKIKAIDGFPLTAGTDMRSIFKSMQKDGADDFEPLENDITLPLPSYSNKAAITPEMELYAATKKIDSYAFGDTDYESLCQAIYQNGAVLLLIKCDDAFWGTATPTFTTHKYGHFVVADGYDDNGIRIIDCADPNPAYAVKTIAKKYITPKFILESGTAVELAPEVKQALTQAQPALIPQSIAPTPQNLKILQKIVQLYQAIVNLVKPKVASNLGSASPMTFITGKKTYILGACGILFGITGFITGHLDSMGAFDVIFTSLGMMGIRNGATRKLKARRIDSRQAAPNLSPEVIESWRSPEFP